jgi:PAS domain S-box-containing protein
MTLVSTEGRLLKVNRVLCAMLGFSETELLRTDFRSITHPDDLEADLALARQVLAGVIPTYQIEKRYLHRDGSLVFALLSVSLVRDRNNEPLYFVSQIENITHRREMDRMKREFISTVSHELRTPLTSIRGSLGLVDAGVLGKLPERAEPMVRIALQNSERLVRIINDILDIEKIESGKLELHIGSVALAPFLKQSLAANQAYGEKYHVQFVLENAPHDVQVRADPDRLMQVMSNLLSNAAKFSPPQAQVHVRASVQGARVRFEVEDHGTGIPEEFRGRIFEKFAQADASASRRFEGTGLGLSITRQLLVAMGGTIGFQTSTGHGTTFHFELPRVPTQLAELLSADPTQAAGHRLLSFENAVAPSGVRKGVPRILHVEDDPDLSHVIDAALNGRAEVITAQTLQAAEEWLRKEAFSLLVLDLSLPDGNGLVLLDRLKEVAVRPVPVLILSVTEVAREVQQRVAAALVKSRLSEGDIVQTILSLVQPSAA